MTINTDIQKQIDIIAEALSWAQQYGKDSFPVAEMKEYRRQLRRIGRALSENCSAAAYGESQVGKSYLMSSLLSSPDNPFVIQNKGKDYSFIYEINSSGGSNTQVESTGVITRFTIHGDNDRMRDFVKVQLLSVADIVMLLTDSYYNDIKINAVNHLKYDNINQRLRELKHRWDGTATVQTYLTEDDVKDISDYMREVIAGQAAGVVQSDFGSVAPTIIEHIPCENWVDVFELLWNKNEHISRLFTTLIREYEKLGFREKVYVPFDAVLRKNGTLLKVDLLDYACGSAPLPEDVPVPTTDILDDEGHIIQTDYAKGYLSALIAEVTFVLPSAIAEERQFLQKIDLLDFPGARSRERIPEEELMIELPRILRRGKVAYLFNKYSRSLRIGSLLFAHHNNQKTVSTLGETINDWIVANVGNTPKERAENLMRTKGISPFFFVATKFNIELEKTRVDTPEATDKLNEHWKRFTNVIPEIVNPYRWFDQWVEKGGQFRDETFQSIYPLRDFEFSRKREVFDGFSDGQNKQKEQKVHLHPDFPNFMDALRDNFLSNSFVQSHFASPEKTWNSVATLNNDGSKAIICDLDAIASVIDDARRQKYLVELRLISELITAKLNTYYEPEDKEENNLRIRKILGDIRFKLDVGIGEHPEVFGRIIDRLMVKSDDLRKIAHDIVVLKTKTPKEFNTIIFVRQQVGINLSEGKDANIQKLCNYYGRSADELNRDFADKGYTLDDVVSSKIKVPTTVADVVADSIIEFWNEHINKKVMEVSEFLPQPDEIAFMLQTMCRQKGIRDILAQKIEGYLKVFREDETPNAIADFSSLTLNNFVSTLGQDYLSEGDRESIKERAQLCNVVWHEAQAVSNVNESTVETVLTALDEADDPAHTPQATLLKLPFWNNYLGWKNHIVDGILFCADISHVDPVSNAAIKGIIDKCANLFVE